MNIEIEAYGDFDIKYTECIMVSSENHNIDVLNNEFFILTGINGFKGFSYKLSHIITVDYISFLELKGFVKLETIKVCFTY